MKTTCIVQARMGSTRLPGKSAMLIAGKPMVWHVLSRVRRACAVDDVVLAIPREPNSEPLYEAALSLKVPVYIGVGNPNDLLRRYAGAARVFDADRIVRVPADNPCVDPLEIDRIVAFHDRAGSPWHLTSNLDRNINGNGYPGGLGAEVYEREYLEWLNAEVLDLEQREHPHRYAFDHQMVLTLTAPRALYAPDLRFDVNTQADLDFIRGLYDALSPNFTGVDAVNYANNFDRAVA